MPVHVVDLDFGPVANGRHALTATVVTTDNETVLTAAVNVVKSLVTALGNHWFTPGRAGLRDGSINWVTDDIRVHLIDRAFWTPTFASDQFFDGIPPDALVDDLTPVTGRTQIGTALYADDTDMGGVNGLTVEALVLVQWTGDATTSRLIAYFDEAVGLATSALTGQNVTIDWGSGTGLIGTF